MMKLERSPSHSWWWDSHNSPKHSRWLYSNLQDLDEKVKEMLSLIEEDADSFAQRAEMYYQKRPELLNLVEEFYRAYRSLAERYDHLTGEIKQNIPKALQVQYGLSCDSPRVPTPGTRHHHYSPLRKSHQTFECLLRKAARAESQARAGIEEDGGNADAGNSETSDDHKETSDEGLYSSSDSDMDSLSLVKKLQHELQNLEQENQKLKDSHQKTLELNATLQQRIDGLEKVNANAQEETLNLRVKVDELSMEVEDLVSKNMLEKELQETFPCLRDISNISAREADNRKFRNGSAENADDEMVIGELKEVCTSEKLKYLEQEVLDLKEEIQRLGADLRDAALSKKVATTAVRFLRAGMIAMVEKNKLLRIELSGKMNDIVCRKDAGPISKTTVEGDSIPITEKLECAARRVLALEEENRKQKLVIIERAEEKREAIRQLCFSLDILKNKNRRLESALCFWKKTCCASSPTSKERGATPTSLQHVPAWKKVLLYAWMRPKVQPYALAL